MNIQYSVVVPVYRGASTIDRLFEDCRSFFETEGYTWEVVFVCDGARDNSWEVITGLKGRYPGKVKGIRLTRNFGQHNALMSGFSHAGGDFIITMDEDLQHSAMDIPAMIARQKEQDYDIIYGYYREKKHNFFRNFTSSILRMLISFSIPDVHSDYSAFRLIRGDIARRILGMKNSYTFVDGYLSWITTHVSSVYVNHSAGQAGKSSYTFRKLVEHSINIFVTFSNIPIRLLSWLSIIFFIFSGSYGLYILIRRIFFADLISGFATFAVLGGFGLGFLLLGMGILGEYIQRINLKTTQRPVFEERDII
jgi:polyisoprenyl-phosphate glycosyltransferase